MSHPTCTRCGATLSPDAAGGLCPRCLMAMNFESRTIPDGEGASSSPPLTPEELADKFPLYDIIECLGRGGMGVVYKARQKTLDRTVAIKLLAGEWQGDPGFAARFQTEAKTLAQMSHPNIVTVHDFGETGGLFYIVMEYVDGVNLRDLLGEGRMAPEQALAIVPPICEALEYAHGKGVVHRDIKPENLLLDRDGRIKIADFGIASLVGTSGEKSGTPPYMAPEQETGNVDRRADIYALGVVLYEMLTGERPTKDVVAPSRKVRVDVKIDELVLRALEKEPERRYQTAGEFRTVVETMKPSPPVAPPEPPAPKQPPGMFRRWWWLFLIMVPLGLVLGLAAGAAYSYLAPKKFEADARILVRSVDTTPATSSDLARYFSTIRSRETLASVATSLDLPNRWMTSESQVIEVLRRIVTVQRSRAPNMLAISVRHTNPQDAVDIANCLAVAPAPESIPFMSISVVRPATRPRAPAHPNVSLVIAIGAGAGLLLSPLLAFLCMLGLQRLFPWRADGVGVPENASYQRKPNVLAGDPAANPTTKGTWALWVLVVLAALVPLLFIGRGGRITGSSSSTGTAASPVARTDQVLLEDLALYMIVAIREKDDEKLRSMAADRMKGWPESLPVFAVELRERMRQITGDDRFDLKAGETLVEGDVAAVRCTGPDVLDGKCLVLFFVRTADGWKTQLLRNATDDMPLAGLLEDFRKQLENAAAKKSPRETSERPKNEATRQLVAAEESLDVANLYLDLELAAIDARIAGLGDMHPQSVVAKESLDRFHDEHPGFPDAVSSRLAAGRLDGERLELTRLTDAGLGEEHPAVRTRLARIDALTTIAAGDPVSAEEE